MRNTGFVVFVTTQYYWFANLYYNRFVLPVSVMLCER